MVKSTPKAGYKSIQLWVILLTPLLVVVSATILFYTGWLTPDTTTNNGDLLDPVVDVSELGLEKEQRNWWLITTTNNDCSKQCNDQLYWVGQVITALGKDSPRVIQKRLAADPEAWAGMDSDHSDIERLNGDPAALPMVDSLHLFVVDPLGNIMLRYGAEHDYEAVLEDLEELLTLSTIG